MSSRPSASEHRDRSWFGLRSNVVAGRATPRPPTAAARTSWGGSLAARGA